MCGQNAVIDGEKMGKGEHIGFVFWCLDHVVVIATMGVVAVSVTKFQHELCLPLIAMISFPLREHHTLPSFAIALS